MLLLQFTPSMPYRTTLQIKQLQYEGLGGHYIFEMHAVTPFPSAPPTGRAGAEIAAAASGGGGGGGSIRGEHVPRTNDGNTRSDEL